MPWLNVFLSGTLCRNISLNVQGSVGATFMHCAVLCCIWFCYQGITWCKYYNRICSLYTIKCEWYCDGNTFSWPVSNTNSIPITSPVCVDAISKYGHKSTWHQSGNTNIDSTFLCFIQMLRKHELYFWNVKWKHYRAWHPFCPRY